MTAATHFVVQDWFATQEGRDIHASLLDRKTGKRKTFGLLEKPSFPPQLLPDEFMYKIFISGKGGVGKTSTAAKLTGNKIPQNHSETPGLQTWDLYWPAKMMDIDKIVMFHLQFWDAGENSLKKFDHIMPACKERSDGILFLFSFTDKSSFDDIPQQMSRVLEANDNMSKFVLGTKIDQHIHSEITQRDINAFEYQWKLPIMSIKNVRQQHNSEDNDIAEVAPILNYLCDQLWLRDQIMAGKIPPPDYTHEPKISFC